MFISTPVVAVGFTAHTPADTAKTLAARDHYGSDGRLADSEHRTWS